jgi:NADH dehydrogenase/NADH:ubiquinone oxidoreductase subunit G
MSYDEPVGRTRFDPIEDMKNMHILIEKLSSLRWLAAACLVVATAGCTPAEDGADVSTDLGVEVGESNVTTQGEWPAEEAPADIESIQEAAAEKVEEIQEAAAEKVEAAQEAAAESVEAAQEAAVEKAEEVQEAAAEAVESVQEKAADAVEAVQEAAAEALEAATEAVQPAADPLQID